MPIEQNKIQLILQELVRRTNDELLRIRTLEDRISGMEERLGSLEEISLQRSKRSIEKFAEMDASLKAVTDEVVRIRNIVEKMSRQMNNVALKRDVKELERMFDLLSPAVRQEYIAKELEAR